MKPLFPDIVVNGETIPSAEVMAEAQNHAAPAGKPGLAWRAAARALVLRRLLLQHARGMGLLPERQEVSPGRFETDEEALIRAVLDAEIEPEPPAEEDLRAVYDAAPEKFRAPSLFEPAHILFAAPAEDAEAREAALGRARSALDLLGEDPGGFGRLARESSDCPSRDNGGRLGQIASGDTVPEFEAAMLRTPEGQIAPEPVMTRYGAHVLRVDAKSLGAVLPYESVRGRIAEAHEKAAWARAARDLAERLIAGARVEGIDPSALAA